MECECGNKSKFKEIITKGITQELTYDEGYVIEELTKYQKERGKAVCLGCGKEFEEYERGGFLAFKREEVVETEYYDAREHYWTAKFVNPLIHASNVTGRGFHGLTRQTFLSKFITLPKLICSASSSKTPLLPRITDRDSLVEAFDSHSAIASPIVGNWVQEQVNESFSRLGVSSVYGLLLHRSSQLLEKDGKTLYQALQKLKESGQVQKIGISIYSLNELETLSPYYNFDLVQAPFNIFDRRLSESGWLQKLKDKGVEIHVRSAFLQGLLLMSREDVPVKFAPWTELFGKWHEWLSKNPVTAIQACLAYPLSFSEIDRVVIGADSVIQLEQIIKAAQSTTLTNLPDLQCDDEDLINPARWSKL